MNTYTPVTFRKFNSGDIIAILPSNPANYGRFLSYQHIGQHGECDMELINRITRPAIEKEYADLLQELISIGYDNLKIYKRIPSRLYHWNLIKL